MKWVREMKTNSTVRFKDEYNGYFKELKDRDLTVMQVFKGDKHDQGTKVTLMEIEEIHLIRTEHLTEVHNANT